MLYLSTDALQAELDYRYPGRNRDGRSGSLPVRKPRAPRVVRPRRDRHFLMRRAVA